MDYTQYTSEKTFVHYVLAKSSLNNYKGETRIWKHLKVTHWRAECRACSSWRGRRQSHSLGSTRGGSLDSLWAGFLQEKKNTKLYTKTESCSISECGAYKKKISSDRKWCGISHRLRDVSRFAVTKSQRVLSRTSQRTTKLKPPKHSHRKNLAWVLWNILCLARF